MILYYKVFGLIADIVLLTNVILIIALLGMFGAALTLPGIAGIVLTVGTAVDANILIYERIREELKIGASPWAAINAGFDKAFSAIADSNVTMFMAGGVLFLFGSGPVRGFAVTLMLGSGRLHVHGADRQPRADLPRLRPPPPHRAAGDLRAPWSSSSRKSRRSASWRCGASGT